MSDQQVINSSITVSDSILERLSNLFVIFTTAKQEIDVSQSHSITQLVTLSSRTLMTGQEDVLFQSETCFQTEYLLMGYLQVKSANNEDNDRTVHLNGQLLQEQQSPDSTHFCVLDFTTRMFTLVRMISQAD